MKLRQTLAYPVNGFWYDGKKQVFDWKIEGEPQTDDKGKFVRVGSWEANFWFNVAMGRTEKLTLSYAKRRLQSGTQIPSTFEYIDD